MEIPIQTSVIETAAPWLIWHGVNAHRAAIETVDWEK
jgi:hypothetical protein